jgi:16S rRNA (cytidine1402-2'-O)-methyltransferase
MPGLSDPGEHLVAAAAQAGFPVLVVPGPSAPAAALAISGLPAVPHLFLGFLPARSGERRRFLEDARPRAETLVWFEAPHRLLDSLEDAARILGSRRACGPRATKIHEEGAERRNRSPSSARGMGRGEVTVVVKEPRGDADAEDETDADPRRLEAGKEKGIVGRWRQTGRLWKSMRARSPRAGTEPESNRRMSRPAVSVVGLTKVFRTYRREEGLAPR